MNELTTVVTVRVPAAWKDFDHAGFDDAMRSLIGDRAAEFGLKSRPVVTTTTQDSPALAVSVNRRPVVFWTPTDSVRPDDPQAVKDLVGGFLLRRLSLLLDGPSGADSVVRGYLTDLGIRPPSGTYAGRPSPGAIAEAGEELVEQLAPHEVVVAASAQTLRRTRDPLPDDLIRLRTRLFGRTGVRFPDVRLTPTSEPPGTVRIRLNNVEFPIARLGAEAGWREVVGCLEQAISAHAHWFVRLSQVGASLDTLGYVLPDLSAASEGSYPRSLLTACLREMVRSGESIRNLPRLLWLLLELGSSSAGEDRVRLAESPLLPMDRYAAPAVRNPVVLASRLRKILTEESWRTEGSGGLGRMGRLPAEVEDALVEAPEGALADHEWLAVRLTAGQEQPEVLVTRTIRAIARVRAALQALPRPPKVVASYELPPDVDLTAVVVPERSS